MDIELDVMTDIFDFSPLPPRRTWKDFIPWFITTPLRLWFGFPQPSPREAWFVSLHVVKIALTELLKRDAEHRALSSFHMAEAPPTYNPKIDPENLN